jgi:hypothetical protein
MDTKEYKVEYVYKHDRSIRPEDVKLDSCGAVAGVFGKYEVEISAGRLVQYFRYRRKGWTYVSLTELRDFYQQNHWDWNRMLFGLMGAWWDDGGAGSIVEGVDCLVYVNDALYPTKEFVSRCARAR